MGHMSKQNEEGSNHVFTNIIAHRKVILSGEVSQRLIALKVRSLARINLVIDSGGASMDAALRLCDLIPTVMTTPVRGIALCSCVSVATFAMLYCNELISTPCSRLL